jgi:hypothetical protein
MLLPRFYLCVPRPHSLSQALSRARSVPQCTSSVCSSSHGFPSANCTQTGGCFRAAVVCVSVTAPFPPRLRVTDDCYLQITRSKRARRAFSISTRPSQVAICIRNRGPHQEELDGKVPRKPALQTRPEFRCGSGNSVRTTVAAEGRTRRRLCHLCGTLMRLVPSLNSTTRSLHDKHLLEAIM